MPLAKGLLLLALSAGDVNRRWDPYQIWRTDELTKRSAIKRKTGRVIIVRDGENSNLRMEVLTYKFHINRYPPVVCTYQSSRLATNCFKCTTADESFSLTPHERIMNQQDDHRIQTSQPSYQLEHDRVNEVPDPVYLQTSQSDYGGSTAAAASSSQQTYTSSQGYYSTPSTTREDYRDFPSDSSSFRHTASSSSAGDYMTGGYYQQGQMSFSSPEQNHDVGYYPTSDEQTDDWLLPSGDPAAFIGTGSAEYYYVSDEHENSRSAPPRHWNVSQFCE